MKIKTLLTSSSLMLASIASFAAPIAAHADSVTVKTGDTASEIAQKNNVSLDTLQKYNQGINLSVINPGQQINISSDVYTVKAGDTLSEIAAKHHISLDDLKSYNHLTSDLINPGQKLHLSKTSDVKASTTQQSVATPVVAQQTQQQATPQVQVQTPTYNNKPVKHYGQAKAAQNTNANYTTNDSDSWAKSWIATRESGGNYSATNGNYYGKYQLSKGMLGGDYSAANQERVANNYVNSRYGGWTQAQRFWQQNGWY